MVLFAPNMFKSNLVSQIPGIKPEDAPDACWDYPDLSPRFTLILTELGGLPGELGPRLDSVAVQTDYLRHHRRTLSLDDTLHISAVISGCSDPRPSMSKEDWNLIIGADKGAPAWLQVSKQVAAPTLGTLCNPIGHYNVSNG